MLAVVGTVGLLSEATSVLWTTRLTIGMGTVTLFLGLCVIYATRWRQTRWLRVAEAALAVIALLTYFGAVCGFVVVSDIPSARDVILGDWAEISRSIPSDQCSDAWRNAACPSYDGREFYASTEPMFTACKQRRTDLNASANAVCCREVSCQQFLLQTIEDSYSFVAASCFSMVRDSQLAESQQLQMMAR